MIGSLTVIRLGTNVIQPGGIDTVRLPIDGFNQFFGFEFFEYAERAVAEQESFTAVAFNGGDAAWAIADVRDAATFGENV